MSKRAGVVTGFVKSVDAKQGRCQVEYRGIEPNMLSPWAYIASPLSGSKRGMLFMPEENDEVLVAYGDAEFGHPYIVGFLWNGEQVSPENEAHQRVIVTPGGHQLRFEDKENDTRVILKSNGKHQLLMEDKAGQKKVELKSDGKRTLLLDDTPPGKVEIVSGKNKILLDDNPGTTKVELRAGAGVGVTITMSATPQPSLSIAVGAGNTLDVSSTGVTLNATGTLTVNGGAAANITVGGAANVSVAGAANFTVGGAVNITAGAAMNLNCAIFNVNAAITNFSGMVNTTMLSSTAIVSPLYSPGVGNLI